MTKIASNFSLSLNPETKVSEKQIITRWSTVSVSYDLTHSERRPQNIYSQEEINLYCIIKLAAEISFKLFSLQISKTWCFAYTK